MSLGRASACSGPDRKLDWAWHLPTSGRVRGAEARRRAEVEAPGRGTRPGALICEERGGLDLLELALDRLVGAAAGGRAGGLALGLAARASAPSLSPSPSRSAPFEPASDADAW